MPRSPLLAGVLIALAWAFLLALALPGDEAAARRAAPDRGLRVMSYNMHVGIGSDRRLDLQRTASALRDSGADVVALQEVDVHWSSRSDFEDQARVLAEELGMHLFFAPIYSFDPLETGQPRREYGLAVLSRYPILDAENHAITRLSTQSQSPSPQPAPGFPEVVLNVRGVKVHVYNTHLDYRRDPAVRRMQVDDMLAVMAEDEGPKVLMGDLNAPPDAPELTRLQSALSDSWTVAGDGGDGLTYPASDPVKRIDYVLASPDIEVKNARVLDTLTSDHLPVVADLGLPGSAVGGGRASGRGGRTQAADREARVSPSPPAR